MTPNVGGNFLFRSENFVKKSNFNWPGLGPARSGSTARLGSGPSPGQLKFELGIGLSLRLGLNLSLGLDLGLGLGLELSVNRELSSTKACWPEKILETRAKNFSKPSEIRPGGAENLFQP